MMQCQICYRIGQILTRWTRSLKISTLLFISEQGCASSYVCIKHKKQHVLWPLDGVSETAAAIANMHAIPNKGHS